MIMYTNIPDLVVFLFLILLCLVFVQIIMLFRIKKLAQKILALFINFQKTMNEFDAITTEKVIRIDKTCQYCKHRIVYFHGDNEAYFYLKCRLKNKAVNQNDTCKQFVLDPQSYKI
mgnify:CR=1 FL=1